jgi:hypothetical protein
MGKIYPKRLLTWEKWREADGVAIIHQIKRKYRTKQEEIVGEIIESAGARSSLDPEVVIKRKAAEVSYLMALLHGGEWRVEIDHENGFVLVAPAMPG